MSDSFFKFPSSNQETCFPDGEDEEDDTDYDALNGETFGEDAPSTDWEEVHELLSSSLIHQRSIDDENNELSERVASSILDDEAEEVENRSRNNPVAGPSSSTADWWCNNTQQPQAGRALNPAEMNTLWAAREPSKAIFGTRHGHSGGVNNPTKKILTVEEVEKRIIKGAGPSNQRNPRSPPINNVYSNDRDVPVNRMRGNMNGHYPRNRQPYPMGRPITNQTRYQPKDDGYHGLPTNVPQFPGLIHQPPRHSNLTNPGRMHYPDMRPPHQMTGPGPSGLQGPRAGPPRGPRVKSMGRPITKQTRYQPKDDGYHGLPTNVPQFPGLIHQPPRHSNLTNPGRMHYPDMRPPHQMTGPGPSGLQGPQAGPPRGPRVKSMGRPITNQTRYQPKDDGYHSLPTNVPQFPGLIHQPPRHSNLTNPGRMHYPDMRPPHQMTGPGPSGLQGPQAGPPRGPRVRINPMNEQRFHPGPSMYGPRMPSHNPRFHQNQQAYDNRARAMGGEPPVDEYAGLMTENEINWLASIQTIQIFTNRPQDDDYYYKLYMQRQKGNTWKPFNQYLPTRNRDENNSRPAYEPHQFENSLGKLQVGSVMAPRLIIDSDVTENLDSHSKHVDKKWKLILLLIEEIYKYVIQMEPNCLTLTPMLITQVDKQEKILRCLMSEDKLMLVMSIRKGRRLILRLLPLMLTPNAIIHKLLVELDTLVRKDNEQILLSFLPSFRTYLSRVPLDILVEIANQYATPFLLSSNVTTSVMANMVERAEQVIANCDNDRVVQAWISTLVRLAESSQLHPEAERPVVGVNPAALMRHFTLLTGRVPPEVITALCNLLANNDPGPAPAPPSSDS